MKKEWRSTMKKWNWTIATDWRNKFSQLLKIKEINLQIKEMKLYDIKLLQLLYIDEVKAAQWRNKIAQLLHNEEIKLYSCYTMKKWNWTISTHWRNKLAQLLHIEETNYSTRKKSNSPRISLSQNLKLVLNSPSLKII